MHPTLIKKKKLLQMKKFYFQILTIAQKIRFITKKNNLVSNVINAA